MYLQDEQNGRIRIYAGSECIAEHEKATGRHQLVMNRKHMEGIRSAGGKPTQVPMPRLAQQETPQVVERELSVYEQFLEEAVLQ
ncbi:hypothetical protein YDYSY3_08400 [Paenibacillus chitinolyticus]|nr:hypothetical protein [Paenibacillus chitinolyticus]GKS09840.1 hypothetical protein YDYSY3_08400 [Paenibacillus chitinolyticus]